MQQQIKTFWRWPVATGLGALLLLVGCEGLGTAGLPLPNNGANPGPASSTGGASITSDPDVSDPCLQVGQPASPVHHEMFEALNRYRSSKGLATLSYSKVLEKAANAHAADMYHRSFIDHENPDGDGPAERAIAAGFCRAWVVGENIAWNHPSVGEVQTAWQNSPDHDANMINANYRYVGMGYYLSANGPYYVQLFGNVLPR